jgi:hypothetical protein
MKECNICNDEGRISKTELVVIKNPHNNTQILEEVFSTNCANCGNLLFGYSKTLSKGVLKCQKT